MNTQRKLGLILIIYSTIVLILLAFIVFFDCQPSKGHIEHLPREFWASVDTIFFSTNRDSLILIVNGRKLKSALPK
ncbi:MAG: hypothetical protein ACE5G1_09215 [bacterium]